MAKVLFVGAGDGGINETIISKINEKKEMNACFMIVNFEDEISKYSKYGQCLLKRNAVCADYTAKEQAFEHFVAVDFDIIEWIDQYWYSIFEQQRRFEEYHAFTIPNTYESHYEIYRKNILFWFNFIKKNEITHLFFSSIPHEGFDMIIYLLAKKMGISVKMVYGSILPGREYVFDDFEKSERELVNTFNKLTQEYADKTIDEILLPEEVTSYFEKWCKHDVDAMTPWNMKVDSLKRRFEIRFGQPCLLWEWKEILAKGYRKCGMKIGPSFIVQEIKDIPKYLQCIPMIVKRWIYARPAWVRTKKIREYYDSIATMPQSGEKYIYFALHYQPEASSNPLGGIYADQRLAVRMLSTCVPDDIMIYIKMHPEQIAPFRSIEYYKELSMMRNVRIISREAGTFSLMQNAVAVSSITGTACWESQFYNIPAILFGNSLKNAAPLSYTVKSREECESAINSIINNEKSVSAKELKLFVKALCQTSYSKEHKNEELIDAISGFISE